MSTGAKYFCTKHFETNRNTISILSAYAFCYHGAAIQRSGERPGKLENEGGNMVRRVAGVEL